MSVNSSDCSHVNPLHGCVHGDPHSYLFYYRNPDVICFHRLPYKPCQFVGHSCHSRMQQSVFNININDEHSGKLTRWVKCINALVLPFPQLPSVRVVSLDPCIGFFQMMGPWTIHFAHLSCYGPVGCGNASCEPIELQPCRSK